MGLLDSGYLPTVGLNERNVSLNLAILILFDATDIDESMFYSVTRTRDFRISGHYSSSAYSTYNSDN